MTTPSSLVFVNGSSASIAYTACSFNNITVSESMASVLESRLTLITCVVQFIDTAISNCKTTEESAKAGMFMV
jgi:hypothetical protein